MEEHFSIEQKSIVGQHAAIREVNTSDPDEIRRLMEIDRSPGHIKWFNSRPEDFTSMNETEMRDFVADPNHHLYIVSGSSLHNEIRKRSEVGRLQGWVKVNPDDDKRVEELRNQKIIPQNKLPVFEISYAKHPDAPSGQMASGVRQVCIEGVKLNLVLDPESNRPYMSIVAYVIDDERGTNKESIQVLEASGFEEKRKVIYDEAASRPDRVFVLNWEKLDEKLKSKLKLGE